MLKRYTYDFTLFAVSVIFLNRFQKAQWHKICSERGVLVTPMQGKRRSRNAVTDCVLLRNNFWNGVPAKNTPACSILQHLCAREWWRRLCSMDITTYSKFLFKWIFISTPKTQYITVQCNQQLSRTRASVWDLSREDGRSRKWCPKKLGHIVAGKW